jgi:HemY protein
MTLKRKIIWGFAMFLCLVLIVWLLSHNQGYVLVVRAPYRIQFSFNFLLFLIVILFVIIHYGLRFMRFLRFFRENLRDRQAQKRLQESHTALIETVDALLKEDYLLAEETIKVANRLQENTLLKEATHQLVRKNAGQ